MDTLDVVGLIAMFMMAVRLPCATEHLVAAGARVLAIELHPGRAEHLRRRFADAEVTAIEIDAGRQLLLPRKPFKVVANPPYAISSALLRSLTARGSRLVRADLLLQKAFARKMAALVPGRGRQARTAAKPSIAPGLTKL